MQHQVQASSTSTAYRVTLSDPQGHQWHADEPAEAGGGGTAPTPFQLLLSALGACTTVTLQMYAKRKGWELGQVHVDCRLNPDGDPARGQPNQVLRSIRIDGELSDEQHQRLLQIADACPVHKLLVSTMDLKTEVNA